jgi:hypothetical protein
MIAANPIASTNAVPYEYDATLAAANWSGSTYTLSSDRFSPSTSTLRTDVLILPAASATDAQVLAWAKADISAIAYSGTATISAAGTKPTVAIPVTIRISHVEAQDTTGAINLFD